MFTIIGKMITQLRDENSLSIEDLARKSGVNAQKIEDIEASRITPSFTTILKLSRVLGSRLSGSQTVEQFSAPDTNIIINKAHAKPAVMVEHSMYYLAPERESETQLEPIIIHLAAGQDKYDMSLHCGDGEIFLYVLQGSIEIHYPITEDNFKTYSLTVGENTVYNAEHTHHLINTDDGASKVLLVSYRQL